MTAPVPVGEPRAYADPLAAIAGFAATLRDHGFRIGVAEQQAMVRAALLLTPGRWRSVETGWRAIACLDRREWRVWPELFERYWFPARVRGSTRLSGSVRSSRSLQQLVQQLHDSMADGQPHGRSPDTALDGSGADTAETGDRRARGGASRTEALHERSLAQWLPQDLRQLERLAAHIAERLRRQLTRRWRRQSGGRRLDLRRTLRASLATGGLPLHPAWLERCREIPRLFILVDVSRSMETHAQLFLRIARAFVAVMKARVFVFHTRLAEVTPLLRSDTATIQEKVNAVTAGFGGGTCIATSLAALRTRHARGQLGRRSRLWVLSDGYDADTPDRLALELEALRRGGTRICWLHPSRHVPDSTALRQVRNRPGLVARFLPLDTLNDLAALAGGLD